MAPTPSSPTASVPFVGREGERARLREGLERAKEGKGGAWALTGPAGVGKTRLLQWLEGEAQAQGYRVLWGYCLKEDVSPFFPFEQILHRLGTHGGGAAPAGGGSGSDTLPPVDPNAAVVIFEEEKAKRLFDYALQLSGKGAPCLLLGRDRPSAVRQRYPALPESARVLWLSRTEGPDVIAPSQMDALGELAENHLRSKEGSVVALAGVEYLVSQNNFLPVLRLLQFLRDIAEGTGGKVLLSVHPAAFDAREFSLLEAEGEVVKAGSGGTTGAAAKAGEGPPAAAAGRPANETSSATLLRYVQVFETEGRHRPLLLILDDFQWADEGSALAFQFLSRNLRRSPVVVVAGARDPEGKAGTGSSPSEAVVVDVLDNLDREGILRRLPLKGLAGPEARSLVEGFLGAPLAPGAPEAASAQLEELTGGNPYYLLQVVGQLKEEGMAKEEAGRAFLALPAGSDGHPVAGGKAHASLPTLRRLVSLQLEALPKEERSLVETAALIGREFDLPPLIDVLGRAREDLRSRADRMTVRPPLLSSLEQGKRFTFQNPIVWEVAREELPETEHRSRARALADWYASRRPEEMETIARLYYEARDRAKGLPWIRRAADKALKTQAGDAVERYVRWAEDLLRGSGEDWEGRVAEGVRLAEGIREQGALRDARRLLQGLLEAGPPDGLRWRVQRALISVQADIEPREARGRLQDLEKALAAIPGGPSPECKALLAVTRAHVLTLGGDWDEGLSSAREALSLLTALGGGDPAERSQALYAAGWCLKQLGRLDEAREYFAQGRAAAAVAERPGLLASHMNGEGAVAFTRGDLPAARRAFEDAVEQARKTGNVARVAALLLNLAEVGMNQGDLEEMRKATIEAQTLAERFDVPRVAANAAFRLGSILQEEKRYDEAKVQFTSALERYERLGLADLAYAARINLALLRGIGGDPQAALLEMDEMVRKSVGVDLRNLPLYHQTRAELKGFVGDTEGTRRELERGLEAAKQTQNLLAEASIHEALATWERSHGDAARAKLQQEQAEALYRQCGVERAPRI
jgi:tetratricopeptide (TPR) repeat protein